MVPFDPIRIEIEVTHRRAIKAPFPRKPIPSILLRERREVCEDSTIAPSFLKEDGSSHMSLFVDIGGDPSEQSQSPQVALS